LQEGRVRAATAEKGVFGVGCIQTQNQADFNKTLVKAFAHPKNNSGVIFENMAFVQWKSVGTGGAAYGLTLVEQGMAAHVKQGGGSRGHNYWIVHEDDLALRGCWVCPEFLWDYRVPETFVTGVALHDE
jgi:hypothetical protein